ncbi:sulfotransferase, partial [Mycobacteroides abscessus subsp. abscessus]
LDIGDLTSPVLTTTQREVLQQVGGLVVDLDPAGMIGEAIEKTRLDDFGDAGFRLRLDAYAGAADADNGGTNLNRLILRNRIVRLLSQRLLLTDLLRR